jgi:U6 snRNA-associated Sm-like protein LSm8
MDEGVEEIPLGLYLVKGDMMCVHCPFSHARVLHALLTVHLLYISILIGEIDEERDSSIDLSTIRADPIPPIRY